jgi:hypothetical protein
MGTLVALTRGGVATRSLAGAPRKDRTSAGTYWAPGVLQQPSHIGSKFYNINLH